MHLKFSRLRWPEWLIGAAGLLLLISMLLLPWFQLTTVTPGPPPRYFVATSVDGWHGLTHARWLILLTVLAAFAVVFFQARERAPALPMALTQITAVLTVPTVAWLVYRVLIDPPGGRQIGGWVALLSATAMFVGCYRSFRLEGIAEADAPHQIPTIGLGERHRLATACEATR
jgi:hypothetical protein